MYFLIVKDIRFHFWMQNEAKYTLFEIMVITSCKTLKEIFVGVHYLPYQKNKNYSLVIFSVSV